MYVKHNLYLIWSLKFNLNNLKYDSQSLFVNAQPFSLAMTLELGETLP